jgi:uncharacterized membrane-anchored protein
MQRKHIPSGGTRYWAALSVASVLGCNTGDAYARVFGLVNGLPLLIALFAVILWVEQRDQRPRQAYYWLAILVVRTAATNIADFTIHAIGTGPAIGVLTLGLVVALLGGAALSTSSEASTSSRMELPRTDLAYWGIMLVAGTLGTAIGDYASFRSGLGLTGASMALSSVVAFALAAGSMGLLSFPLYYWFTIVGVRAAGTAVGDFFARHLGLLPSTVASGILLVALLSLWKEKHHSLAAPAE